MRLINASCATVVHVNTLINILREESSFFFSKTSYIFGVRYFTRVVDLKKPECARYDTSKLHAIYCALEYVCEILVYYIQNSFTREHH